MPLNLGKQKGEWMNVDVNEPHFVLALAILSGLYKQSLSLSSTPF